MLCFYRCPVKLSFCFNLKIFNICFRQINYSYSTKIMSYYQFTKGEEEELPPVYILSRIKGLTPPLFKDLGSVMDLDLCMKQITLPTDSDVVDPNCVDLKEAVVVIADPVLLGRNYKNMPNLKWAHCTWAGVESLFEFIKNKPDFVVTRHSHEEFSDQMAEYVLAQILIHEKNLKNIWVSETEKNWSEMKESSVISQNRSLKALTLGILGVGNMGQGIAKVWRPHGTKVIGFSRRERKSSEFAFFNDITTSLTKVITSSDYIINTLPSTPLTAGLLNGNILEACTQSPVFINVGRSNIINESTILKALEKGWLRHAILDVFDEEPLPMDSVLWKSSGVTITPHCAAVSRPEAIAEDFIDSLLCYIQENVECLENVLDWENRY